MYVQTYGWLIVGTIIDRCAFLFWIGWFTLVNVVILVVLLLGCLVFVPFSFIDTESKLDYIGTEQ